MLENNWFAIQTSTKRESELARRLRDIGVDAYAPRYSAVIIEDRRRYERPQPLFPSYLFVSPAYRDNAVRIKNLPSNLRSYVVGEIELSFIDEMRGREVGGLVRMEKVIHCPYEKGDEVRVNLGYGAEVPGVFDSALSDNQRCVILVTMFNQTKAVPVFFEQVSRSYEVVA